MSSDVETFALPDRVELRPVVPSDNLSERILLVSCLLDVLFPSAPAISANAPGALETVLGKIRGNVLQFTGVFVYISEKFKR